MGNTRWFEGGRKEPEYVTLGEFHGIKIVKKLSGDSNNTPMFSNSSKYYACADSFGEIKQFTCYNMEKHGKVYDADWTHAHGSFKEGEIHIHYYDENGKRKEPVAPNKKQLRIYKMLVGRKINDKGELE